MRPDDKGTGRATIETVPYRLQANESARLRRELMTNLVKLGWGFIVLAAVAWVLPERSLMWISVGGAFLCTALNAMVRDLRS